MNSQFPDHGLRLTSTLDANGTLTLGLADVPVNQPSADQVLVQVEATPINPSDLITMLAGLDPAEARFDGTPARPRVRLNMPPEATQAYKGRLGQALAVGLEGAGVVVAAGSNAEHLLGKKVAVMSLTMGLYSQYLSVSSKECVVLPEGVSTAEGAAIFVNPLTALAMVETARLEGHNGLIHTAAASNLGQMLVKICLQDGVPLVNIVRRQEQVELLRELGAAQVCNSSATSFRDDLLQAVNDTGATLAFDAIGGGTMAAQLLAAMEAAAVSRMPSYSSYGSFESKQVYIYGRLDASPTTFAHLGYGMQWGVGGWAMPPILDRAGPERSEALRRRVLAGLTTTFVSYYCRHISLAEALQRDVMLGYHRLSTAEKYLIRPQG